MKSGHMRPVFAAAMALLLVAVTLFGPGASLAGTETPVNGLTGICIEGKVVDVNHDPIPNIVVSAALAAGPPVTVKTDASGAFRFDTGIVPGTWTFSIAIPATWQAVTPASVSLDVAYGHGTCYQIGFKVDTRQRSCITGQKVDADHKPLEGWTILAAPTFPGAPTYSTNTNAAGDFTFPDLVLGTWIISEQTMAGWTPVTPSSFSVTLDKPSAPPNCEVVRFKNRPPDLCIKVKKVDENGNPLSGWDINVHPTADPNANIAPSQAANGTYWFYSLTAQTYAITEKLQPGWAQVSITPPTVKPGPWPCTTVTIVNRSPRCTIDVFKRDDLQAPLAGWPITLLSSANVPLGFKPTDGTGHVAFTNLLQGMYWVKETMQPGWMPLVPPLQAVTVKVNAEGICRATVNFVNRQIPRDICIDGKKWDVGRNVGMAGVPIMATLQGSNPPVVQTTTTAADGSYRFSGLTPGTYVVTFNEPAGFFNVGPASKTVTVNWPPKQKCEGRVDFFDSQNKYEKPPDNHPPDTCRAYHVVQSGQTLSGIAARYGTSVARLMAANGIQNADLVRCGQKLCIP